MDKDERNYVFLQAGRKIRFRQSARKPYDVESFLQVELMDSSGKTLPIYRCDIRPIIGYHVDMYNIEGKKEVEHKSLKAKTPEEAISEVIKDLKENLPRYLKENGFIDYVTSLPNNWKEQLDNAEKYIIDNLESPEEIKGKMTRTGLSFTCDAVISEKLDLKLTRGIEEKKGQ